MKQLLFLISFLSIIQQTIGQVDFNFTSFEPICYGDSNGSIYVNTTSGTPPFTITITDSLGNQLNSNNSNAAELIPSGWYYILVVDNNGLSKYDSIFLDQPDSIQAELFIIQPQAPPNTGTIEIINIQGAYGSVFSLLTGNNYNQTGTFHSSLDTGLYQATILDSAGCIWQHSDSIYYQNLNLSENTIEGISIYQNPKAKKLQIKGINSNDEISLYSTSGKLIYFKEGVSSIDYSSLKGQIVIFVVNRNNKYFRKRISLF